MLMREEALSISTDQVANRLCTLSRRIPAIALEKSGGPDGRGKLGLILHLAAGSDVEICGEGFNSRTVKVRQNDMYYFIFAEDLPVGLC
jgi:hypothetical protein